MKTNNFRGDLTGISAENRSTTHLAGQELAKLGSIISDVRAEIASSLATDYESVKADEMDGNALGKKLEQLKHVLGSSTVAEHISAVVPAEEVPTSKPVDVAVVATAA